MLERTLFYAVKKPFGCFSNFSPHGFDLDGFWWKTSEHYYQANKFDPDSSHYLEINQVAHPGEAAEKGRDRTRPLRSDWEQVKDMVMLKAVYQKFYTHADIRNVLRSTGNSLIVENSPTDYYWGCGKEGNGQNKLGLVLMKVREMLSDRNINTKPNFTSL